jgi:energy-coupling factor transport system ATP-binding protein
MPGFLQELEAGRFLTLHGPNFSGRSYVLRRITGLEPDDGAGNDTLHGHPRAYIGPELYNAISGLAPTVEEELRLHLQGSPHADACRRMVEEFGLSALGSRNPVTLSGGEQAMLTLVCAIGLAPAGLALDGALEQVSPDRRVRIIEAFLQNAFPGLGVGFCDNRLAEYPFDLQPVTIPEELSTPPDQRVLPVQAVDGDRNLPLTPEGTGTLTLDALDFRYPAGPHVIRNLSLALEPGRLYTLVGKNGVGKSTLARLLCGVLKPDSGRILFNGTPCHPWRHPGKIIGYHFQNPDMQLFSLRVDEEIAAGPGAQGMPEERTRVRVSALLEAFGLSRIRDIHPLEAPFVLRKRIALAATLAMSAPWIILDEPTLGQDDATVMAMKRIIDRLLENGYGVVVISHSEWFRALLGGSEIRLVGDE